MKNTCHRPRSPYDSFGKLRGDLSVPSHATGEAGASLVQTWCKAKPEEAETAIRARDLPNSAILSITH